MLEAKETIGVMRAIGASSWQVVCLFVGEGIFLGLISWLIALPLSIPTAMLLRQRVYPWPSTSSWCTSLRRLERAYWLLIITMLAIFASAGPLADLVFEPLMRVSGVRTSIDKLLKNGRCEAKTRGDRQAGVH